MPFLIEADYQMAILPDELTEITRDDAALKDAALEQAEGTMKPYLHDSYDTDTIFAATGTDRHATLVRIGVDIAVYYLTGRLQAGQDLSDRKSRYDRAIQWLKALQKSEVYADLPRRAETEQKHITYGSNTKRSNHY